MTRLPFKIGIAGSHSTGKSTFVERVQTSLQEHGLKTIRIDDLATRARALGFPILTEHTYESTLWIMAECMRQEAEASLSADVIIVDRPVPDALGYLLAALEQTGRTIEASKLDELRTIAVGHARNYDWLAVTVLDPTIPLGPERDRDPNFRAAAAMHVTTLMEEAVPSLLKMTTANTQAIIDAAVGAALHASEGAEGKNA